MPRALVIGGGVAGPATAQLLARDGWDTHVYEAHPAPDPYAGLFLNVATNGLAVLETLGLRDALLADGHRAGRMVMWSRTGKELGAVPNGPAGEPERGSVVVRRSRLHQVLREGSESAGVPTTYGARLVTIEQDDHGVRATFADGSVAEGDLLVGADGIGSPTRRHIDPSAPEPTYTGLVGVGGFARVPGLAPTPETQHFVFGARAFFGYLVRADGTAYWFANVTAPDRDAPVTLDSLRELHADDPFPVPDILRATADEPRPYPIDDLTGVRHWSRGRVVAVGDAVHATSPSSGQGSSLALEDAAVLARELRDQPSHAEAFAAYQAVRQPRAAAVARYARAIDSQKRVTTSRVGVAIRDAMMPVFLRRAANDTRNDWLYNHTVE